MWTTLNFGGTSKTKNWAKDIYRGDLDIECDRDWPVSLDATLGDGQKIKNYFLVSEIFLGRADSVILLGIEWTINLQNLIKMVGANF